MALAAGLLIGGLTASTTAASAAPFTCGGTGTVTKLGPSPQPTHDGSEFLIECPAVKWNGTLLLYSHGYVVPGHPNPAKDAGDPVTHDYLLAQGFALAGSSYAHTGWAIQEAGEWHVPGPAGLNSDAAALGPLNIVPAAFTSFRPTHYPRPFDLGPGGRVVSQLGQHGPFRKKIF
jgi:hypothetical protein